MPSSLFFNGLLLYRPGSYSVIDASGLESVGLGATGIVAVLGEAVGGKPVSEITEPADLIRVTKPEQGRQLFRSGPLREVMDILFAPSKDQDIPGGASQVIAMKVNPATQSSGSLANTYGDALDLVSADYGAFTSQINVTIADGTNQGKLLTITFEDTIEVKDDLGGDSMFDLSYVDSGAGWDAMIAEVEAGGAVVATGTRQESGLDSEITAQPSAASVLDVVSSNALDVGMQVIVYGLNAAGTAAVSESFTLDGTSSQAGQVSMSAVLGARIVGTTVGTVTVSDDDPATILTIAAGTDGTAGLVACEDTHVAQGAVTAVAGGASTDDLVLVGLSKTGAAQLEQITLNGTTPVPGVAEWSELQYLAYGAVAAATAVTLNAEAARTVPATHNTLQKVADYFNAKSRTPVATTYGFICNINTGLTSFDPADLDNTTDGAGPVSCLSPAAPDFYADLWAIQDWIENNSALIVATVATGAAGGAPSNTTAPVYLTGGVEGTTTAQDWQDALNLLKQVRVNTVVPLTYDPSVHAAADAHAAYMCGQGRSERDVVVGLLNSGGTDLASKAEIKSQIIDLNSKYTRAVAQAIERYNTAGEREEFDPPYLAAAIAGMQAGSPIGTPLTFKYANVLSLRQAGGSGAWNPVDDGEEMIQAGLCFLEEVEGVGRRVVRNNTTHLTSNNLAYCEASVVEAASYAAYTLRTNLEVVVGRKGFSGTINSAKGVVVNLAGLLIDEQILVAWRSLNIDLVVDVLSVELEMAPVLPINFVASTFHLVTIQQSA